MCFSYLFTYVSTYYILTFILNNLKNWICVFLCCIFAISIKQLKNNTMKNIKHGTEEIKVTDKIYASYSIRNKNLLIYKGYKSDIFYLTYSNVVIMIGKDVVSLLDSLEDYLNTIDGLDNQLRAITDNVKQPLYKVLTKDNETISIYKLLKASDSLEMLETSEIHGGKYAIYNKEIDVYKFGLSFEAAQYIFNNK